MTVGPARRRMDVGMAHPSLSAKGVFGWVLAWLSAAVCAILLELIVGQEIAAARARQQLEPGPVD